MEVRDKMQLHRGRLYEVKGRRKVPGRDVGGPSQPRNKSSKREL